MQDFNNEMRKGQSFVGAESLDQFIVEKSKGFGGNDCLYLNYGLKWDSKDKVDKPFAVVKCKYTGCQYTLNFKVDANEQNTLVYRYKNFKQQQHLETAHG